MTTPDNNRIESLPDLLPLSSSRIASLGIKGLHYGSGTNLHPECLNTDVMQLSSPAGGRTEPGRLSWIGMRFYYLQHDATKSLPVAPESFEWVYSEHFIEHIPQQMAVEWLKEVRRLLKPGGYLRLSTPDLRIYAKGYLEKKGTFFKEHAKRLDSMGVKNVPMRPAWMVNQIFRNWGHQWIYDVEEIRFIATLAEFSGDAVKECYFRSGKDSGVSSLDLENRSDESLYVEIFKDPAE
jgi:predicted SAM-dependent methyltransferase